MALHFLLTSRKISIHAPREGSDGLRPWELATNPYFNPRSPRGERPPTKTFGDAAKGKERR